MGKEIKTTERVKFDNFKQVQNYVLFLKDTNLHNIDIDPPATYSDEKWHVRVTWHEEVK